MKYKEIVKKLKKMGCQEIPRRGGGSHRKWYNPQNNTVVPSYRVFQLFTLKAFNHNNDNKSFV